MSTFHTIADRIATNVQEVLKRFDEVGEEDPWINLPGEYRVNYLSEVIALASTLALCAPDDEETCRKLVHGAAHHGETRLEQGLPDSIIFREVYLVRESVWSYIRQMDDTDTELATEAILRIDMALSLASKASLRGYHRPAFQARGSWPQAIDGLVDEWNPPPPVADVMQSSAS